MNNAIKKSQKAFNAGRSDCWEASKVRGGNLKKNAKRSSKRAVRREGKALAREW